MRARPLDPVPFWHKPWKIGMPGRFDSPHKLCIGRQLLDIGQIEDPRIFATRTWGITPGFSLPERPASPKTAQTNRKREHKQSRGVVTEHNFPRQDSLSIFMATRIGYDSRSQILSLSKWQRHKDHGAGNKAGPSAML